MGKEEEKKEEGKKEDKKSASLLSTGSELHDDSNEGERQNLAENGEKTESDPAWNSVDGYKTRDWHTANADELTKLLEGRDVKYEDHPLS